MRRRRRWAGPIARYIAARSMDGEDVLPRTRWVGGMAAIDTARLNSKPAEHPPDREETTCHQWRACLTG